MARPAAKSRMKARICPQLRSARGGCAAAPSAPAGPYLRSTERAQQRVDLVDPANQPGPAETSAAGEFVVVGLLAGCVGGALCSHWIAFVTVLSVTPNRVATSDTLSPWPRLLYGSFGVPKRR